MMSRGEGRFFGSLAAPTTYCNPLVLFRRDNDFWLTDEGRSFLPETLLLIN